MSRSSSPLVGDLEPALEPTDQGTTRRHTLTARDASSRLRTAWDLRVSAGSTRYSILYSTVGAVVAPWSDPVHCLLEVTREVVETRRLELLTFSLQRRCSSS